jgi:tetratricopeptide (TPR) repeat protein
MLEQVTAREPTNVQAWVQLGNEYFDTRQPKKAIDAYQRALDQQPNDPNVLTDQGVMYRELGQSEAALKNFLKASQIDPQHLQSRFNVGIVYAYDLKDTAKAAAAWNELAKIAPTSPQAMQAKQHLGQLQGQGGGAPAR